MTDDTENTEETIDPEVRFELVGSFQDYRYGPVPMDTRGGTSFRFDLSHDEEITRVEFWGKKKSAGKWRISQLQLRTSRGRAFRAGRTEGDYRELQGRIIKVAVWGGSTEVGSRVKGLYLENDLGQSVTFGRREKDDQVFSFKLGKGTFIRSFFGRRGADLDQLGIIVRKK